MSLLNLTKKQQSFIKIWGAVFVFVSLVNPLSVSAQINQPDVERITLSPVSKRYDLAVGELKQDYMTVINDGKTDYDFVVYARPYSVTNETYDPNFSESKPNADAYQWVQFEKPKYHLKAGERVDVKYSLRVPEKAAPGGHYGALFAETQPKSGDSSSVVRKKRVGSIVYATVKGPYLTDGSFAGFKADFWQTKPPLQTSARVTNSGNVDFRVTSKLTVSDVFGRVKYDTTGEYGLLPGTTRKIVTTWDKSPSFGLFKVSQKVSFLNHTQDKNSYTLLLPRWVPALLVVLAVAGGAYAVVSHRKRRR